MSISIEDVAKRANVSISTVSRVVNHRNVVNPKTRARVEVAIKELGYRPNAFARGLMLKQSHILALVLPDLHGEFYSEIIRGANLSAHELGYQLIVSSIFAEEDGNDVLSTVMGHSLVDGVAVMVSEVNDTTKDQLSKVSIPLVIMDGDVEGVKHDNVLIDQRHGAKLMLEHLIQRCKAKRITFVGGLSTNLDTIERFGAFRDMMQEAGLLVDESNIFYLDYSYSSAFALGLEKVQEWFDQGASIFAANDEMAAGIIDAAIEHGLSVPADLPVVGFDDTRIAQMTRPRLTTVRVPMSSMGATAIELLCKRIEDPDRPPVRTILQSDLAVRESCRLMD